MVEEAPPGYMAATESSARPRSRQRLTCLFRRRNSRSSRLHPFPEKTLNDETNMEKAFMEQARLGLIGDNIAASQAPRLHALAGALQRIAVRYDLLVPAELGLGFDALFDRCADGSYYGINVTHPYKERAAARVEIENPLVRAMGAVNLVRFAPDRPRGFNTDYTGFLSAYRAKFGIEAPGIVGHDGTPIPPTLLQGAAWAFDAVYTPVHTRFLADAAAAGLDTVSGFELFFHQGADGFEIFFGGTVDRVRLRQAVGEPGRASAA